MKYKNFITYPVPGNGSLIAGSTVRGLNYALYTAKSDYDLKKIESSRNSLKMELGFQELITLNQVHSDGLHFINPINSLNFALNPFIEGDGILSAEKGFLLGVLTADCIPIFYTDENASFAGIVHAGWKGIEKGIHRKMILRICDCLKISALRLYVIFGPHIRKCCYEVGSGLMNTFAPAYFEVKNGIAFLDLESIVFDDLIDAGLRKENIYNTGYCTRCGKNPEFYSCRGGDEDERTLSFIGLTTSLCCNLPF
jgi:hypothetical protein